MKKHIIFTLILCLLVMTGSVFSQNATNTKETNLTGKWILDPSKSELQMFGASIKDNSNNCRFEMIIEQQNPEIKIKRTSICGKQDNLSKSIIDEGNYLYFSDERGETNNSILDATIISKTKWDKDVLTTEEFITDPKKGKKKLSRIIEFRLSGDAKTLIVTIKDLGKGSFSSMPNTSKNIYTRSN